MSDQIPSFDDPAETTEKAENNTYLKMGILRRSNAITAVIACVITGLLMAAGFIGAQRILPKHAPDARTLAEKTIKSVTQVRSFSFEGTARVETQAEFLPAGETLAFKGFSGPDGLQLTVGETDKPFMLTVSKNSVFVRVDGEWMKIPHPETKLRQQIKTAVAQPDELKTPVLFDVDAIQATAIEGPEINGISTWEIRIDPLSLFGEQAYRLASTLSGTNLLVYVDRETYLPVQAKVTWAANANDNKQLLALKLGPDLALDLDIMFNDWGESLPVNPPKEYRDVTDFTVSKEGAQIG